MYKFSVPQNISSNCNQFISESHWTFVQSKTLKLFLRYHIHKNKHRQKIQKQCLWLWPSPVQKPNKVPIQFNFTNIFIRTLCLLLLSAQTYWTLWKRISSSQLTFNKKTAYRTWSDLLVRGIFNFSLLQVIILTTQRKCNHENCASFSKSPRDLTQKRESLCLIFISH